MQPAPAIPIDIDIARHRALCLADLGAMAIRQVYADRLCDFERESADHPRLSAFAIRVGRSIAEVAEAINVATGKRPPPNRFH